MRVACFLVLVWVAGCQCARSHDLDDAGNDTRIAERDVPTPDVPLTCAPDLDGDGLDDAVEGTDDPDGDGLPNRNDPDSDGDGLTDTDETLAVSGLACRVASSCDCAPRPSAYDADPDLDGVNDGREQVLGTSSCSPDSDGDGCPDGETGCGTALDAAFVDRFASRAIRIRYVVPPSMSVFGVVELRVDVAATFGVNSVMAVSSTSGTVSGERILNVAPGSTVEFEVTVEGVADGPNVARVSSQLVGDGAELTRRPLVIFGTCTVLVI